MNFVATHMPIKHLIPKPIRRGLSRGRAKTFAALKKSGHALGLGKFIWKTGLPSEVSFWNEYLATGGKSCDAVDEFKFRIAPDSQLQPWLCEWLDCPEGSVVRVLDVGAGPLTWIGKKWAARDVQIEAIDPLAEAYDQIMNQHGIRPPVRTKKDDGEEVVRRFGRDGFDLAFARNCLDHAYDAIQAVTNMIEATKPGGVVFLWHNEDEAERLSYQGLHQWNFHLQQGELVVWKGKRVMNVNQTFAKQLKTLRCELRDGMIQAVYRKLA